MTKQLTKEEFETLGREAKVRVEYESRFVSGFRQDFSRERYPDTVKLRDEEWDNLWSTYHSYYSTAVFTLVED